MLHHSQDSKTKLLMKRTNTFSHQTIRFTRKNRYPNIFKTCAEISPKNSQIMSFGCSTGEECETLRSYFPDADIIGIDSGFGNIEIAKQKNQDSKIHYDYNIKHYDKFNLIFCMSVFCKHPATNHLENCSQVYDFDWFEKDLSNLVKRLNLGGCIVVYNSNFKFCDTIFNPYFKAIPSNEEYGSGFVRKFNKKNNRIYENYHDCIFKKSIMVI